MLPLFQRFATRMDGVEAPWSLLAERVAIERIERFSWLYPVFGSRVVTPGARPG
ncbi:MAG: hypothetical protein ACOZNI_00805 [Myxococcota bacterium]